MDFGFSVIFLVVVISNQRNKSGVKQNFIFLKNNYLKNNHHFPS